MFGLGRLPRGGQRDYGRGGGRRDNRQPYALILAMQLLHQISQLQHKPPLTLAMMAGMSALHLKPDLFQDLFGSSGMWSWLTGDYNHVRSVCLLPASIIGTFERTGELEIRRLLLSPFVHLDDMHLYYNMASFLLKGVSLELTMGTQAFAGLLAFTLLASQTLMMLAAWVLLEGFDTPSAMNTCTVGFSGVLFALKYALSRRSPGVTMVMGFRVHTRYAAWLELVLISVLVPNASFLGHLCGILAGILYVEVPVVLRLTNLLTGATLLNGHQRPSYTYNSGTSGASPSSGRGSGDGRAGTTQRQSPPPTVYGVDDDAEAEEAALQEALRRSLLDSGGGGGGSGSNAAGMQGGEDRNDAAAASRILGSPPPPPMPTAPPSEEQSGIMGRDELRRRRLQRLAGDM
ncbi:unnamed protein product [Hapterophycus canaliculatus]